MISDWSALFEKTKAKPYSATLNSFLNEEYQNHIVYPPREKMFTAFSLTKPSDIKVVIIGQDPYHNPGQAMGMSFSVPKGMELPPSLINIYKEIEQDTGDSMDFANGDLSNWAKQGVLLLNAYLSVRENQPLSHARKEYVLFMQDVVAYLETLNQPIVYLLWGGFAKRVAPLLTNPKHIVLSAVHPSPLSANRGGWFGQHLFSQCNRYLSSMGVDPIVWGNKE